jgi:hypothetical protein
MFGDWAGRIWGSRCNIHSSDRNKEQRNFHKGHEGSRLKIKKASKRIEIHHTLGYVHRMPEIGIMRPAIGDGVERIPAA